MPAQLLPKLCERGAGSAAIFFGLFLSFSKLRAPGNREAGPVAQLPAKGNSQSLPGCWVPPCSGALKILQVQPARRPGGLVGRGHVEIFYKSSMLVDREVWSCLSKFYKSNYLVDREVWSGLVKFLQVQLLGRPGSLLPSGPFFPCCWLPGRPEQGRWGPLISFGLFLSHL